MLSACHTIYYVRSDQWLRPPTHTYGWVGKRILTATVIESMDVFGVISLNQVYYYVDSFS